MIAELSQSARRQIAQAAITIKHFALWFVGITLRPYQLEAANAIIKSVFNRDGLTFVIIFSRQSGKDETLAIIFLFLLLRFIEWGADMVCAQPTFKPQTINAMERLRNRGTNFGRRLRRTACYIMRLGQARVSYFSTDPSANVVGATADRLLVINEAQDVDPTVYDKRFSPMAASGNATKVFSGTSWTTDTLLEREKAAALIAEKQDGIKRVFIVDSMEVAKANPLYGRYVEQEIQKLGRQHPLIRSQYFCETIDAQAGMFNAARRALMQGDQPAQSTPIAGHHYAFCIDVAGQDEALLNLDGMGNPGRDSTTLSIVDIDLSTLPTLQAPTYRIVSRHAWQGQNHLTIFGKLKAFADQWRPQHIVIDATGVGEGLWAMLDKAFPARVIPVKFTQQTKSEIGWRFLAIIETGRIRDCSDEQASSLHRPLPTGDGRKTVHDVVRLQYDKCQSEILPGPAKTLRWGVKDGTRGPDGGLIHDDYILADSLVAELDTLNWSLSSPTLITQPPDYIKQEERNF